MARLNPRADFEIAVIGGGAAGCVVASRLARSGDRSVSEKLAALL